MTKSFKTSMLAATLGVAAIVGCQTPPSSTLSSSKMTPASLRTLAGELQGTLGALSVQLAPSDARSVQAVASDITAIEFVLDKHGLGTERRKLTALELKAAGQLSFGGLLPGEVTLSVIVYGKMDASIGAAKEIATIKAGEITSLIIRIKLTPNVIQGGNLEAKLKIEDGDAIVLPAKGTGISQNLATSSLFAANVVAPGVVPSLAYATASQGVALTSPSVPATRLPLFPEFSWPVTIAAEVPNYSQGLAIDGAAKTMHIVESWRLLTFERSQTDGNFVKRSETNVPYAGDAAFDALGNVWVASSWDPDRHIYRLDSHGKLSKFKLDYDLPAFAQGLSGASRIAVSGDGKVYVAPRINNGNLNFQYIVRFDPKVIATDNEGSIKAEVFVAPGQKAVDGKSALSRFEQMAFDPAGNLWVPDQGGIRKIAADGTYATIIKKNFSGLAYVRAGYLLASQAYGTGKLLSAYDLNGNLVGTGDCEFADLPGYGIAAKTVHIAHNDELYMAETSGKRVLRAALLPGHIERLSLR